MESGSFFRGKKVFITGHTGFKGSWLSKILIDMGACVKGYSLSPYTDPSHFELLKLDMISEIGDIRDEGTLQSSLKNFSPEIVFHLAAQPLVRQSYVDPIETYDVNVLGTAKVLNACRSIDSLKSIVCITTDKVYENQERSEPYVETDPLGGFDPYSNSKACSELVVNSFRQSFFNQTEYGKSHNCLMATARAGNVIGGGDWAADRLLPDLLKGYKHGEIVSIRNPQAIRPWQHVLEPLAGYLMLAHSLFEGELDFASAWNFGPQPENFKTVGDVIEACQRLIPDLNIHIDKSDHPHEAGILKLDSSKAEKSLLWNPRWNFEDTIEQTVSWYLEYYKTGKLLTESNIASYFK